MVGSIIVTTTVHAQSSTRWQLVQDLRIGTDEEHPAFILEAIRYLSVGPAGRVYAGDAQSPAVLIFERDGKFVRAIGRRGMGPGEFQTITGIGWIGDTLWVADRMRSQVTFFTANGIYVSTRRLPPGVSAGRERPARAAGVLSDGSVLALAEPSANEPGEPLMQSLPMLRYHEVDGRPDTLLLLKRMPFTMFLRVQGSTRALPFSLPNNSDRWEVAPDGSFVVAVRADELGGTIRAYTVEAVDGSGRTVFRRRYEHDAVPVTGDERNKFHAAFADNLVRLGGMSRVTAVRRARELLPIPQTRLAADYVVVGRDGRIWLHRRDLSGGVLVILDHRTGTELGRASLPNGVYSGVGVDAADADSYWMVERDSVGIPYIVRYRIQLSRGP